jgi:hypothetical protein
MQLLGAQQEEDDLEHRNQKTTIQEEGIEEEFTVSHNESSEQFFDNRTAELQYTGEEV